MATSREISTIIDTEKGKIHCVLHADLVPLTIANWINLAQRGFYDNLVFHRVINKPPFVTQGGCPEGDGTGTPGYRFEDEFHEKLPHDKAGIISMANMGPNTNGSQFFFTLSAAPWLNKRHVVFGEIMGSDDLEVINAIEKNDRILSISICGDTTHLLTRFRDRVSEWNKALDRYYPTHTDKFKKDA